MRSRTGEEHGHPLEAITPQKRAHVIRAARLYLEAESPRAAAYRFDVVAVTFWPDGRPPSLVHIPTPSKPPRPTQLPLAHVRASAASELADGSAG